MRYIPEPSHILDPHTPGYVQPAQGKLGAFLASIAMLLCRYRLTRLMGGWHVRGTVSHFGPVVPSLNDMKALAARARAYPPVDCFFKGVD